MCCDDGSLCRNYISCFLLNSIWLTYVSISEDSPPPPFPSGLFTFRLSRLLMAQRNINTGTGASAKCPIYPPGALFPATVRAGKL